MKISELKGGYHLFGNKGNVWNNNAHIAKSGEPVTMCDTPMLSTNWARIEEVQEIGCPECLEKYHNELMENQIVINKIIELFDYPESIQEVNAYKELGFDVRIDDALNDIYSAIYMIDDKIDAVGVLSLIEDCERRGLKPNVDTNIGMFNFEDGFKYINQMVDKIMNK